MRFLLFWGEFRFQHQSSVFKHIFSGKQKRCIWTDEILVKNGDVRDTGTGKMFLSPADSSG